MTVAVGPEALFAIGIRAVGQPKSTAGIHYEAVLVPPPSVAADARVRGEPPELILSTIPCGVADSYPALFERWQALVIELAGTLLAEMMGCQREELVIEPGPLRHLDS